MGAVIVRLRTNEEVIEDALYNELRLLLVLCTEEQEAFLWRIYLLAKPQPKFPLKAKDIEIVLSLVRRTVVDNARRGQRGGR